MRVWKWRKYLWIDWSRYGNLGDSAWLANDRFGPVEWLWSLWPLIRSNVIWNRLGTQSIQEKSICCRTWSRSTINEFSCVSLEIRGQIDEHRAESRRSQDSHKILPGSAITGRTNRVRFTPFLCNHQATPMRFMNLLSNFELNRPVSRKNSGFWCTISEEIDRFALKNSILLAMTGARRPNVLMQWSSTHRDLPRRLNESMLTMRRMEHCKSRCGSDEGCWLFWMKRSNASIPASMLDDF
jgi:hypothetical protein